MNSPFNSFKNLFKKEVIEEPTGRMKFEDWENLKYMKKDENWGDPSKMSSLLLYSLDALRDYAGVPLLLACQAYSVSGHSLKGEHPKGNAADIRLAGLSALEMYLLVERFNFTGIGVYPISTGGAFLHTDVRKLASNEKEARWIAIPNDGSDPENKGSWTYLALNAKNFKKYIIKI